MNQKVAHLRFLHGMVAISFLATAFPVRADVITLPDAVWSGTVNTPVSTAGSCCIGIENPITGPGDVTTSQTDYAGNNTKAQVQSVNSPLPSINASAQNDSASQAISADADGNLTYFIEVVGPSGFVPLNVSAFGSVFSTSGLGQSQGVLQLNFNGGNLFGLNSVLGVGNESLTHNQTLSVNANDQYEVFMHVAATTEGPGVQELATAFLDLFFSIDQSFANANAYSIVTSSGIGNSPPAAVPEPATLDLFGIGVAVLGLARRRSAA